MPVSTELRGTAYHEAAHVIALRDRGIATAWVEVTTESSGATQPEQADFSTLTDKDVFVIALAGIHAESRVRPNTSVEEFAKIVTGGTSDRHRVDTRFRKRCMTVTALSHQGAHNAAEACVTRNWPQIAKVAEALLRVGESGLPARLNGDDVEKAIIG